MKKRTLMLMVMIAAALSPAAARAQQEAPGAMSEAFDGASSALAEDSKSLIAMGSVLKGGDQELAVDLVGLSEELGDLADNASALLDLVDASACGVTPGQRRILNRRFTYGAKDAGNLNRQVLLAGSHVHAPALRDAATALSQHAEHLGSLLQRAETAYALHP